MSPGGARLEWNERTVDLEEEQEEGGIKTGPCEGVKSVFSLQVLLIRAMKYLASLALL